MKYIAIDCTSESLCILAKNGERLAYREIKESKMQHSTLCMPLLEKVLQEAELTVQDCDFLCGVTGPGSFTGIRVGLSTIMGLAVAAKKKAIGVTSLQMLAYDRLERFLAVIDAGKNHFYVCGYDNGEVILPPAHISLAELEVLSKDYPLAAFTTLPLPYVACNRIDCLHGIIEQMVKEDFENYPLSAYYIKRCQAEENLRNKGGV